MKKNILLNPAVIIPFWSCYLVLLLFLCGSCINIAGCVPLAKYERTVQLSAPLSPGSAFSARTHNGYITIAGAEVTDCNLTATIIARALTGDDAEKLANRIKVKLERSGSKLTARIEKPVLRRSQSVSVNLGATVPNQTDLELTTHNGAVKITNITGKVNGTTHNGKVTAEDLSGTIKLVTHNGSVDCKEIEGDTQLRTHNGSIVCKEVSGDMKLRTRNGKIYAAYSESASSVFNATVVTHNGGIDFTAPPNISAKIEARTHNGSINTDLPITVIGKISKRKLTGTIGAGQGKLYLETHNGSIKIR